MSDKESNTMKNITTNQTNISLPQEQGSSAPIAVIDIGSTSMRMVISQVDDSGQVQTLESLQQEVTIGRDTFTRGYISRATTEECVFALKSFSRILNEYGITSPSHMRTVATSAVREATNREAFLDRLYIATGISAEPIDVSEVNRFTYLSVLGFMESNSQIAGKNTIILEVGGGSTELLIVKNKRVTSSHSYRLGAFRMREQLEEIGVSDVGLLEAMENQIHRTVEHIRKDITSGTGTILLIMGGDARFAANHLLPGWDRSQIARIPLRSLANFTSRIIKLSVDDIVHRYKITYASAETLGPALLSYVRIAEGMKLRMLYVAPVTMREGIVGELALGRSLTMEFQEQIIHSALELGKKYEFDQSHAQHVASLSRNLFRELAPEHQLSSRYELILVVAAILHEIGLFISNRSHHKHSMYLIQNSELFGLGTHDLFLTALVARYHSHAMPLPSHEGYNMLDRQSRISVAKMAAILRIADALDCSYSQRIQDLEITLKTNRLVIGVKDAVDLSLEKLSLFEKGGLYEQIFGKEIILVPSHTRE
ncbi:MAG: exopolyphosphatase [Fibrobacterota bacterium]